MANPNIVNVTKILANTVTGAAISSNTVWHINPASSGSVHKINSISIANIHGTANVDFDLIISNAGSNTILMKSIVIPSSATIVAVDKSSSFYLLENSKIGGKANANSNVKFMISLDQIY